MRGEEVILDSDLGMPYGVETGALTRAMKRNQERLLDDSFFQLSREEHDNLKSQHGGRRTPPGDHGGAARPCVA